MSYPYPGHGNINGQHPPYDPNYNPHQLQYAPDRTHGQQQIPSQPAPAQQYYQPQNASTQYPNVMIPVIPQQMPPQHAYQQYPYQPQQVSTYQQPQHQDHFAEWQTHGSTLSPQQTFQQSFPQAHPPAHHQSYHQSHHQSHHQIHHEAHSQAHAQAHSPHSPQVPPPVAPRIYSNEDSKPHLAAHSPPPQPSPQVPGYVSLQSLSTNSTQMPPSTHPQDSPRQTSQVAVVKSPQVPPQVSPQALHQASPQISRQISPHVSLKASSQVTASASPLAHLQASPRPPPSTSTKVQKADSGPPQTALKTAPRAPPQAVPQAPTDSTVHTQNPQKSAKATSPAISKTSPKKQASRLPTQSASTLSSPKRSENPAETKSEPTIEASPRPTPENAQLLLLTLAEEYVSAAYKLSPQVLSGKEFELNEEYNRLMALGLNCMEVVLRGRKLLPRMEASLRLRYSILLFQETVNTDHVEETLTKGIALCERNKLFDLKYAMQHLLARVFFQSNHRVGLKFVDNLIPDVEAYQHVVWIYAFRFLRISLSQQSTPPEHSQALQHLRAIVTTAESRNDSSMLITAASLGALVHLKIGAADAAEQAQHSIAAAHGRRNASPTAFSPEITTLLDYSDLACLLQQGAVELASNKMKTMQPSLDKFDRADSTEDDGTFSVLIESSDGHQLTEITGGIFHCDKENRNYLTLSWLRRRDLYVIGYYLSGVTAYMKNANEEKAEKYFREGEKMILYNLRNSESLHESLSTASGRISWQKTLLWFMRIHLAFILCSRSDWDAARKLLKTLNRDSQQKTESMHRFSTYLEGIVHQGSGELSEALASYRSPCLAIPQFSGRMNGAQIDLPIAAALNCLSVISDPTHPEHYLAEFLVNRLEPLCLGHANKSLLSAFYFSRANSNKSNPILTLKENLQAALSAARSVFNNQLMCLAISLMTSALFRNIAGDQSEKSAGTSKVLAERSGSQMWMCVADGMLAETLEKSGKQEDADKRLAEAEARLSNLPAPLRETCTRPAEA